MLTALLMSCLLRPPSFGTEGPLCPPSKLTDPCECSEAITWGPVPGAEWYEVTRRTISTGTTIPVGDTKKRNWMECVAVDENEECARERMVVTTTWLPEWDSQPIRANTVYEYTVKACNPSGCAALSAGVLYAGVPMACYEGGRETACYPGDQIVAR